jgi:signal transduction histidine kinase
MGQGGRHEEQTEEACVKRRLDAGDEDAARVVAIENARLHSRLGELEAELQQQLEMGEHERRHWARQLHDDALQGMAAIRISLAVALQSKAGDRPERLARAAAEAVDRLEEQIDELRQLVNDLRPTSLERLGLAGALEVLAKQVAARRGFSVEADIDIDGELTGEEERVVYRLVQEALNNVASHASATGARVDARLAAREVHVTVADDGQGFDTSSVARGHGLTGMHERVEMLGGELEVRSEPAAGTRIVARIPVRPG